MADVLLTHSYHLPHDPKQMKKMQPYPPLGTLYAATALRAAGISVAVFDPMFGAPVAGFQDALLKHEPRIVVIYEDDFNFVTKMCLTHMRVLANRFSSIARSRGLTVIAHGSDETDHPEEYFAHGVAYVLIGEAEQTLTDLCTAVLSSKEPTDIPGLVIPAGSPAQPYKALSSPKNPSWVNLPRIARDLIDIEPYREAWVRAHGYFSMNVVSSRGCPYRCNWCAKPISGDKFRLRPPDDVAAEMKELKDVYGTDHIWFGDDVFALDHRWMDEFASAVESHGCAIPFKIQSRADLITDATVAELKRAGCVEIWMGVESGSPKILNAMNKGLKLVDVHRARERLARAGIRACYFLQFGYPGEGWSEICQTMELVRQTHPDDVGISVSYPLPGTIFFDRVQAQLGSKRNWQDSDDLCAIFVATYTDEFYLALRKAVHAEVSEWNGAIASSEKLSDVLWKEVLEMEPESYNLNASTLRPDSTADNSDAAFLPLDELITSTRRA